MIYTIPPTVHFTFKETKAHSRGDLPMVANVCVCHSATLQSLIPLHFLSLQCWPRPDASWANRPQCLEPTPPQNGIMCLWLGKAQLLSLCWGPIHCRQLSLGQRVRKAGITPLGLTKPQLETAALSTTACPGWCGRRLQVQFQACQIGCQVPAQSRKGLTIQSELSLGCSHTWL